MTDREFQGWPKIARWEKAEITISEKLDGTNACIVITEDDIYAQSRTRVITPEADNFGFAAWVAENSETLRADLGVGRWFGEWYGLGIQRKYGLDHKRFALFDHHRWNEAAPYFTTPRLEVVTALYVGPFDNAEIAHAMYILNEYGSQHIQDFRPAEGIVVYLHHTNVSYKITDAKQGDPNKHKENNQ